MHKNLKLIKKAIKDIKNEKELFESLGWIVDRLNDAYYDLNDDDIIFDKPAKIVYVEANEELVIHQNEISRSEMTYENFSRYEKNGQIYAFKSTKFSSKIQEQKSEPLLEYFDYNYIDSFTVVYQTYRPISALKFLPQNKEEAKKHILSLEKHKKFGGIIWHDQNSDKNVPAVLLTYSGVNYYRLFTNEKYVIHSNTMILPKKTNLISVIDENMTLFKTHYKIYKKEFKINNKILYKGIAISLNNKAPEEQVIIASIVSEQKMKEERKRFESIMNDLKVKHNIVEN